MERYSGKLTERDGTVILDAVVFSVDDLSGGPGLKSFGGDFQAPTTKLGFDLMTRAKADYVMQLDDGRKWRIVPNGVTPGSTTVRFRGSSSLNE